MYKVYGKEVCPNCDKAKALLEMKDLQYEYIDIEEDEEGYNMLKWYGFRSVPQIWKGEEYVGGLECLKRSLQ